MAVRGIDSLRSPLLGPSMGLAPCGANAGVVQKRSRRFCRGSPLAGSRSVQLALPVVESRSGVLIPPVENIKKRARTCVQALIILNMAVRGDSNPRYVAVYTLSRRAPSATRTPHHIVLLLTLGGQRGATIGSCVKTVKHIFFFLYRSLTQ